MIVTATNAKPGLFRNSLREKNRFRIYAVIFATPSMRAAIFVPISYL
jgi:hypothetical protein